LGLVLWIYVEPGTLSSTHSNDVIHQIIISKNERFLSKEIDHVFRNFPLVLYDWVE